MFLKQRDKGIDIGRALTIAADGCKPGAADAPTREAYGAQFARGEKRSDSPTRKNSDADARAHHLKNRFRERNVGDLARRNAGGNENLLKHGALLRGNGVEKEVLIGEVFGAYKFAGC